MSGRPVKPLAVYPSGLMYARVFLRLELKGEREDEASVEALLENTGRGGDLLQVRRL